MKTKNPGWFVEKLRDTVNPISAIASIQKSVVSAE
jgi:hypothetical protein